MQSLVHGTSTYDVESNAVFLLPPLQDQFLSKLMLRNFGGLEYDIELEEFATLFGIHYIDLDHFRFLGVLFLWRVREVHCRLLPAFETIASQSSFKGSFVHSDMMMLFQHQRNLFAGKPFVEIMFDNTLLISTGKFVVMVFIFGLATCIMGNKFYRRILSIWLILKLAK